MGLNFGLAFQLSDDLLDLYADPGATGKPKGTDLSSGIFTIAVIHALETDQEFARNYSEMITCNELTKSHIENMADAIRGDGSLQYTRNLVQKYSRKAMECLDRLPDGKFNDAFRGLVDVIAEREY